MFLEKIKYLIKFRKYFLKSNLKKNTLLLTLLKIYLEKKNTFIRNTLIKNAGDKIYYDL